MRIQKSEGYTPTEKLLSRLCERTFLKFSSYPNPFKEDRKELCDLLAVFDDRVFIFFDRESRKFDTTTQNISVTWNRWKKEAIDNQIRTLRGAERYIREGKPIFLDNKCKSRLPFNISNEAKIHKFIVAHGAKEACKIFSSGNVYGSLAISYSKKPSQYRLNTPFLVELEQDKPIHVLDSFNIGIVLRELDTFFDFISYIDEKEEAIRKHDSIFYCGEEDLLAHYFLNYDQTQKKYRIAPENPEINFDSFMIEEGEWENFVRLEAYKRRKQENKISYIWDDLIQKTYQNALNGTLMGDFDLGNNRRHPIHEMAKEPRMARRMLSKIMLTAINNFPETGQEEGNRRVDFISSFYESKGYVFLQVKFPQIKDSNRKYRQYMLRIACGSAKNKFPHLNTVVGIAMFPPKFVNEVSRDEISEDFALLDCSEWTEENKKYFEQENEYLEFFNTANKRETRMQIKDFPEPKNTN